MISLLGCTTDSSEIIVKPKVHDKLLSPKLEHVKLRGKVGTELDKMISMRITSEFAAEEIIPEATNAFRTQQDDKFLEQGEKRGIWQGEFWGKWILSAVAAYHYTGDEDLKNTIRNETLGLISTQRADGYIGTYENSGLVEGNVWNVWCRKYTLWGLLEAYELLGDEQFLTAAQRHMDHMMTEVGPDAVPIIRTGNFVGLPSSSILSPLLRLYQHTGGQKYLDYAEYIIENWASDPGNPPAIVEKGLEGQPVHLWFPEAGKWTKAYEFISCVEGLVDLYKITANEDYLTAAKNIFKAIREYERVITGGIGYHDKLVGASRMADGLNEPCDVVYWERLAAKLLALTGDQQYADEIERLTYNTLLGTFNVQGDWGLRRMGLNEPHYVAPLHCYTHHHHCCVANIPRGILQLGAVAIMTAADKNELFINLFIPGTYTLELADGSELDLEVNTNYPENGKVEIIFKNEQPVQADIKIRQPDWCPEADIEVTSGAAGNSNSEPWHLSGLWKAEDHIMIDMPMPIRLVSLPDSTEVMAMMRGPLVLARTSLLEGERIDDPLALTEEVKLEASTSKANKDIWLQYTATLADGEQVQLIDYASTGRWYQKPTDPQATHEMIRNRVDTDQRVWFRVKNE